MEKVENKNKYYFWQWRVWRYYSEYGSKNPAGSICYIIGIPKKIREKINKQSGDIVKVSIKEHE